MTKEHPLGDQFRGKNIFKVEVLGPFECWECDRPATVRVWRLVNDPKPGIAGIDPYPPVIVTYYCDEHQPEQARQMIAGALAPDEWIEIPNEQT